MGEEKRYVYEAGTESSRQPSYTLQTYLDSKTNQGTRHGTRDDMTQILFLRFVHVTRQLVLAGTHDVLGKNLRRRMKKEAMEG